MVHRSRQHITFQPHSICRIRIQIHSETVIGFSSKSNGLDSWVLSEVTSFMVALCNRETIYIFMLWFVLLLFFPRLISAAADWMSAILPHMVWP